MAIEVSWLLEDRVILAEISGVVSQEDLPSYDAAVQQHLNASTGPTVHLVVDQTRSESKFDTRLMAGLRFPRHPKLGWMIPLGATAPGAKAVGKLAAQSLHVSVHNAGTRDEALDFLQRADATLPLEWQP